MSTRTQRICAWTGPAMILLFLIGFSVSGFITPNSPKASAEEIARMFDDKRTAIRFGLVVSTFAAALLVSWASAMYVQLKRAAGRSSPVPLMMALSSALLSLEFIYLLMFWQTAGFREDWSPDEIRLINDLAWIPFIGITSSGIMMALGSALPILADTRENPVFPRWLGYFNLWVCAMFTPGSVNMFFKDGPLAYNGLLAWYVPIAVYTVWLGLNTHFLLRAIDRQKREQDHLVDSDGRDLDLESVAAELVRLRAKVEQQEAAAR